MAHALNLVLKIKQDHSTQATLGRIKAEFSSMFQPKMEQVFRNSEVIHFARVLVIEEKYLVIIAEYDGASQEYTEFFRRALPELFSVLFSLAEGISEWANLDSNTFFQIAAQNNVPSLGNSVDHAKEGGNDEGYLFSAYGTRTVKDILSKLD